MSSRGEDLSQPLTGLRKFGRSRSTLSDKHSSRSNSSSCLLRSVSWSLGRMANESSWAGQLLPSPRDGLSGLTTWPHLLLVPFRHQFQKQEPVLLYIIHRSPRSWAAVDLVRVDHPSDLGLVSQTGFVGWELSQSDAAMWTPRVYMFCVSVTLDLEHLYSQWA